MTVGALASRREAETRRFNAPERPPTQRGHGDRANRHFRVLPLRPCVSAREDLSPTRLFQYTWKELHAFCEERRAIWEAPTTTVSTKLRGGPPLPHVPRPTLAACLFGGGSRSRNGPTHFPPGPSEDIILPRKTTMKKLIVVAVLVTLPTLAFAGGGHRGGGQHGSYQGGGHPGSSHGSYNGGGHQSSYHGSYQGGGHNGSYHSGGGHGYHYGGWYGYPYYYSGGGHGYRYGGWYGYPSYGYAYGYPYYYDNDTAEILAYTALGVLALDSVLTAAVPPPQPKAVYVAPAAPPRPPSSAAGWTVPAPPGTVPAPPATVPYEYESPYAGAYARGYAEGARKRGYEDGYRAGYGR
jgi:hypothetical protein